MVSTDEVYRFAVMSDTNLTARFTPVKRYALYLNASTGGTVTSVEGLYPAGTIAAVVAEADSGYTFVNWTSSSGGTFENANSASTRFTMPAGNTVLTANFAKIGGGDVDKPELPIGGIALLPSLTERQTGNSGLSGLDVSIGTKYNGVASDAVLIGGKTLTVDFGAVNTSIKIKSVQFILALHDANGKLVDMRMQEALIAPNGGKIVNLQMQIPQNTNGLSLRAMVWDSSSAVPYTCATITGK